MGQCCDRSTIHRALVRMRYCFKKTLKAAEQNRSDVAQSRVDWANKQLLVEAERLVFIDESAAKTNMPRLYGRSKREACSYGSAPHEHWATTTLISSIRLDGSTQCLALSGGTTKKVFREYIRVILCPALRVGDCVVMDNLSTHKDAEVKALTAKRGAKVGFLPAYSPDFNPIEKMWSKVKAKLRALAPRTHGALIAAVKTALQSVTPQDAQGWFASCGYVAV